jgi:arylsulfatase A-like enzyme
MRSVRAAAIAFLLALAPYCYAAEAKSPKLIVQITMDQLRGDLLRRYVSVLDKGFRRIEKGGYWIRRGDVDFGLTLSFPGHATLATGMYPSHHGLTANEWWIQQNGKWGAIDVTDDSNFRIIGSTDGGASPKFLVSTTLGEWVKKADPRAKAIALGTGARIPMSYAGHSADGVYWFDTSANGFTTTTFYADHVAEWIAEFNVAQLPQFEKTKWELTVPRKYVSLASSLQTFEGGRKNRPFPHVYEDESISASGSKRTYARWFNSTPMKDEALFALAIRAVDAERLGQRGVTDYLAIDVDSTDNIGHQYGPRSLEQLDTLARLDAALDRFLHHLDESVGKDNYVLALAADHGVADPPESRVGGRRVTTAEIESLLDRVENIVRTSAEAGSSLADRIVNELRSSDFIADAYTEDTLSKPSKDPYVALYARAFKPGYTTDFPLWSNKHRESHPARFGIIARFKEGMVFDAATGVHGSPYSYDRDVPIIFYGRNVSHGAREHGGRTVDVAPTLGAAAGITPPQALDGHPLQFVVGRPAKTD